MQTALAPTTATTIETLSQLERRLNVAVPLAQIEGEVEKRLARARQDRQASRIPARQGTAQDGRAAVRLAGSLRCHLRRGANELQRCGARAEHPRCGLSAHRAQARCGVLPATHSSSRRFSRSIQRSRWATCRRVAIERPQVEVSAGRHRPDARTCCASSAPCSSRYRAARNAATASSWISRARSTASSFPGGRRRISRSRWVKDGCCPEFEAALLGASRRRDVNFPLTFPGRLPRQGSCGTMRPIRTDGESQVAAPNSRRSTPRLRTPSGSRAAASTDLRAEVEREPEARVEAQARGGAEGAGAEGPARRDPNSRCPKSLVEPEAQTCWHGAWPRACSSRA